VSRRPPTSETEDDEEQEEEKQDPPRWVVVGESFPHIVVQTILSILFERSSKTDEVQV
jgi:hypothetical protein